MFPDVFSLETKSFLIALFDNLSVPHLHFDIIMNVLNCFTASLEFQSPLFYFLVSFIAFLQLTSTFFYLL